MTYEELKSRLFTLFDMETETYGVKVFSDHVYYIKVFFTFTNVSMYINEKYQISWIIGTALTDENNYFIYKDILNSMLVKVLHEDDMYFIL